MDKGRILQYQKKYAKEKNENKHRKSNEKNIILNTPKKNQYQEIQTVTKTSKKNFPKTISAEKMYTRKDKVNEKNEDYSNNNQYLDSNIIKTNHNKFKRNINSNHNIYRNENHISKKNNIQKEDSKYIKTSNIDTINKILPFNLKNKEKIISKFNEADNYNDGKNKNFRNNRINNNDFNIDKNNLINKRNEFIEETPKKLRSASVKKVNLTYSKFINNLKIQMENFEEKEKNKNKRTKNIFSSFLNQFINKDERIDTVNDNKASIVLSNSNNKYSKKINNFENVLMNSSIHFCIEGIVNNKNKKIIEDMNKEILNMKKELNMKQNKIDELLEIIKNKNSEFNNINNKYNNLVIENNKLKEEINTLNKNTNKNNINNNPEKPEIISNLNNEFENNENNENFKYNNLITYNINKNNNYNIINSEINNFHNFIENKDNKESTIKKEESVDLKEKEIIKEEIDLTKKKERKASLAFERFKRVNKINSVSKEKQFQKSEKISNIARMLENQIGNKETRQRNTVINIYKIDIDKNDGISDFNDNIVNLIDSQPVINKKKKKSRSFSFQG